MYNPFSGTHSGTHIRQTIPAHIRHIVPPGGRHGLVDADLAGPGVLPTDVVDPPVAGPLADLRGGRITGTGVHAFEVLLAALLSYHRPVVNPVLADLLLAFVAAIGILIRID